MSKTVVFQRFHAVTPFLLGGIPKQMSLPCFGKHLAESLAQGNKQRFHRFFRGTPWNSSRQPWLKTAAQENAHWKWKKLQQHHNRN